MKNRRERKSLPAAPQIESNVEILINKMQQQLVFLERKIDMLISRPSGPAQPFGHSHGQDREKQDNRFRERKFYQVVCADCNKQCEVPFKPGADRPVYCRECFAKRKADGTLFKRKREEFIEERDFTHRRHSDKQQGDAGHKAGQKKKPLPRRRKKRA